MADFLQGSLWRKWDIHIHTPASHLSHEFPTDWDEYVKALFRIAIEKGIVALGITDYFTIDGYKKLRTEYLDAGREREDWTKVVARLKGLSKRERREPAKRSGLSPTTTIEYARRGRVPHPKNRDLLLASLRQRQ